jgi:hypothetical protein
LLVYSFFTAKRTILKGSKIVLLLTDSKTIELSTSSGAFKYSGRWLSLVAVSTNDIVAMSDVAIDKVTITNSKISDGYSFATGSNCQYDNAHDGSELFKLICRELLVDYYRFEMTSCPPNKLPEAELSKSSVLNRTSAPTSVTPLNRQYNLNSKYGRKMARRQAAYNYENGSDEYRQEIDNMGCFAWAVLLIICALVFLVIWAVSGPEAAVKWLK